MTFLSELEEIFNAGDPIVRSWPLVGSYWHPFLLSGLYVFFIKRVGPAIMRDRKPFDLRLLMIVYNFTIVLVYAYCLLILVYYFLTTDAYRYLCSDAMVLENHWTHICSSAGWYIYILKYVEFSDTVFFILRKKDHLVTNLHVIHHAVLPILVWSIMRTETSGFQFIPGGINSFIHLIMYTYYGLAAMGPEVQKKLWWKEYLTLLQIGQFLLILAFMFIVVPLSGCKTTVYGVYLDIIFASLFLGLFLNFYIKTYKASVIKGVAQRIVNNGAFRKSGVQKSNGVHESNGMHKSNGVQECNGVQKSNGVHESNGVQKSNGVHISNGECKKEA